MICHEELPESDCGSVSSDRSRVTYSVNRALTILGVWPRATRNRCSDRTTRVAGRAARRQQVSAEPFGGGLVSSPPWLASWRYRWASTVGATAGTLATAPIRFGLTPVFLTNDLELLGRLQLYLQRSTGYPVSLITRRTYQKITALLTSGQLVTKGSLFIDRASGG